MACSIAISGWTPGDCFSSKGGVRKIYIGAYKENAYQLDANSNIVTGFTSGASFYEYKVRKELSSMESTATIDNNGSNFVTTNAVVVFSKMDANSRIEANALLKGEFLVIVEDANGNRWALGVDEPVSASEGTGSTGTARTDANQYSITLADVADNFPPMLKGGDDPLVIPLAS